MADGDGPGMTAGRPVRCDMSVLADGRGQCEGLAEEVADFTVGGLRLGRHLKSVAVQCVENVGKELGLTPMRVAACGTIGAAGGNEFFGRPAQK